MKAELEYQHTLKHQVDELGCTAVALRLGLTRAAVSHMLRNGREVYLKKIRGRWCYAEIKDYKHARTRIRTRRPRTDARARAPRPGQEALSL